MNLESACKNMFSKLFGLSLKAVIHSIVSISKSVQTISKEKNNMDSSIYTFYYTISLKKKWPTTNIYIYDKIPLVFIKEKLYVL